MPRLTRRRLLGTLSLSTGAGALSLVARDVGIGPFGPDSDTRPAEPIDFDPVIDGFGFDNYATPPESPSPSEFVSRRELRDHLTPAAAASVPDWLRPALDGRLRSGIRTIVDRLRSNADRLFGTKGYCYGMVATAQWYAELPTAIPVDRDVASEIRRIDAPADDPSATPVRDVIERFQRGQFTDADSWLRRWPLLRPERIDYRAQARELRDAIDEYGSAGVTITGENVVEGHYVLCYDYEEREDGVTFAVYDPNVAADEYAEAAGTRTIGIDTAAGEPLLESYAAEYDRFLFVGTDRDANERVRSERDR